jgi:hypothetical protein
MSVFHRNWNDDPKEFLDSYIQCTATGSDDFKRRQFINYLGAGSDADDWFDELPQEEKKDWAAIEFAFRKKWLKEEVISIKEIVTTENEPQPMSTPVPATLLVATTTTWGTQTETTTFQQCQHVDMGLLTRIATSQLPVPPRDGKNAKMDSTTEISQNTAIFSSTTLSATVSNQSAPSTAITAREMRPTTANFVQKSEKPEKPHISNHFTETNPSPCTPGPTNDIARAYASLPTPNHIILHLPATPTTTSSSVSAHTSAASGQQKSAQLHIIFDAQAPTESLEPISIATDQETRSESASSMENHQNVEKSAIFTQKPPEQAV